MSLVQIAIFSSEQYFIKSQLLCKLNSSENGSSFSERWTEHERDGFNEFSVGASPMCFSVKLWHVSRIAQLEPQFH